MPRLPTLLLLLPLLAAARAAETPAPAVPLAPVRVTADLWGTDLDRIPASVTVLDAPALAASATRHFGDLVDQIPCLTWTGGSSRPRYLQLRGVGENSQYEGETPDSAVRFLVDDFDFTGLGGLAGTFDVDQVEVLRGPQAGAFGANAAGGLVRLVTTAPSTRWSGRLEATAGGNGLSAAGLAFGGALVPGQDPGRPAFRLSLQRHTDDGFRRNVTLGRATNARTETTGRLRLATTLPSGWRLESGLLHARLRNGFDEFALDNNGERTFSDQPGRDDQDSRGASLRAVSPGPGLRLTTVTQITRTTSRYSYDDDWTPASYAGFSDLGRRRTAFSQELRLDTPAAPAPDAPRWTLGAWAGRTDETSAYTNEDPENLRGLRTTYRGDNGALFGQAGWALAPGTRLTAGLRAERIETTGRGVRTRFRKVRGSNDPIVTFAPAFADSLAGGRLVLEHDLGAGRLAWISLTRGYKAGGINVDARISPPTDPLTYGTEDLWNWEAGLRGQAFAGRLRGEATAFFLDRRQVQVRDSAGFGGNYRFFTANGNTARGAGLEAAATWVLARAWSVQASGFLQDSDLAPFRLASGLPAGGRRLANTPRHGHTVALRHGAGPGWFGRLEHTGRAAQFDSNNHDEARRSFGVWNATLGYATPDWTLTLWARNLTDAAYDKRVFFFGNEDPDYEPRRYTSRADPRQAGVTLSRSF
ncbi:MAG: hypothetical protein B9S27_02380 [Opitutia bacterium Tous-C8FEB]|nr:MAG: hypothetical protein B9S27_02380 [Opitutae bacterium Tous-C8FEB]